MPLVTEVKATSPMHGLPWRKLSIDPSVSLSQVGDDKRLTGARLFPFSFFFFQVVCIFTTFVFLCHHGLAAWKPVRGAIPMCLQIHGYQKCEVSKHFDCRPVPPIATLRGGSSSNGAQLRLSTRNAISEARWKIFLSWSANYFLPSSSRLPTPEDTIEPYRRLR
ncbi:uncharacterized protein BJX67DRAFT_10773 [Aspergillus lucknowensis]|uniref:Uncharacterized protein n=1 Tax=Aspergillus lucknowensis TaxID=176173 RepID=A0ABR4M7J7_9EURO